MLYHSEKENVENKNKKRNRYKDTKSFCKQLPDEVELVLFYADFSCSLYRKRLLQKMFMTSFGPKYSFHVSEILFAQLLRLRRVFPKDLAWDCIEPFSAPRVWWKCYEMQWCMSFCAFDVWRCDFNSGPNEMKMGKKTINYDMKSNQMNFTLAGSCFGDDKTFSPYYERDLSSSYRVAHCWLSYHYFLASIFCTRHSLHIPQC